MQGQMGRVVADHAACTDGGDAAGGDEAKRVFEAMMTVKKIDIAAIKAARRV